jgi:hypothetical protein
MIKRIFHPYWLWEDWKNGLFNVENEYSEKDEEILSKKVKDLLILDASYILYLTLNMILVSLSF